jgi:hypothetical protein
MLQLSGIEAGDYEISIFNPTGEKLSTRSIQHDGGSHSYLLILNPLWTSGIYTVQINNKALHKTVTVQLVITR